MPVAEMGPTAVNAEVGEGQGAGEVGVDADSVGLVAPKRGVAADCQHPRWPPRKPGVARPARHARRAAGSSVSTGPGRRRWPAQRADLPLARRDWPPHEHGASLNRGIQREHRQAVKRSWDIDRRHQSQLPAASFLLWWFGWRARPQGSSQLRARHVLAPCLHSSRDESRQAVLLALCVVMPLTTKSSRSRRYPRGARAMPRAGAGFGADRR